MALSNLDKSHMEELLLSLNTRSNKDHNILELVKSNHSEYAQLKLIAKQINMLRGEALQIVNKSKEQEKLHKIKALFKLVSGRTYYLYKKTDSDNNSTESEYFSMISPKEWGKDNLNTDTFLGAYYYDFDKKFIKHEE
jgi:hypothetical protein